MLAALTAGALVLFGIAAVGGKPAAVDTPAADPSAGLPPRLSLTGLYAADGSVDPRNRPFSPQYPLWTDGAGKARWVHLPPGARIDVSDVDAWRFPVGTTFWKEFGWAGRKVETRIIRRDVEGWRFGSYAWLEDQTDALLAPPQGLRDVYEVAPRARHDIPSLADCAVCHGSAPSFILGFSALQLSDDRDPHAPHAEVVPAGGVTLGSLVAEGLLEPPRPELQRNPPRVRESDPVARAAVGYLSANCGHCHHTRGALGRLDFGLLQSTSAQDAAATFATTLDVPSRYLVPDTPEELCRIVSPGHPEHSALLYRMRSRRPASQMPPVGSALVDVEGVALVEAWIRSLVELADAQAPQLAQIAPRPDPR